MPESNEVAVPSGLKNTLKGPRLAAAGIGAVVGAAALFMLTGASAELSLIPPDDLDDQVAGQIVAMMSLERSIMGNMTADRLAELGGVSFVGAAPPPQPRARRGLGAMLGLNGRAEADAEAVEMASAGQMARAGTEISPTIASFSLNILDAMPPVSGGKQLQCLSQALYFEARGEDIWGQMAVAEVILNRVDADRFPNSICAVVKEGSGRLNRCQFSYYCDGRLETINNPTAYERMQKLAAMMIEGRARVLTGGATFYHADSVNPSWAAVLEQTAKIGDHIFYRYPDGYLDR